MPSKKKGTGKKTGGGKSKGKGAAGSGGKGAAKGEAAPKGAGKPKKSAAGRKKDKPFEPREIRLTEGSQYEVQSLGSREKPLMSKGVFLGYTTVGGHAEAICLELDSTHKAIKGKVRVIPTHMILSIDIIKEAEEEEEGEPVDASRSYM